MGFREHSSVVLQLAQEKPSMLIVGVLGTDFPPKLQEAQSSGSASGATKPAGLCLILPVDQ
jgi:hypothetical protein